MKLADRNYQGKELSNSINRLDIRTNIRYYIIKGWATLWILVLLEVHIMEEDYQRNIIELVKNIKNLKLLKLIYNFVNAAQKEEKAGS